MIKIVAIVITSFIVVIAFSVAVGNALFFRQFKQEVIQMFENSKKANPKIVSEADIEGLPEPVQRWLRYSQVVGKERIQTVRLKQNGFFRTHKDKKWMPFTAEEYYTTDPPAFIWYATIKAAPLFFIKGRDRYDGSKGNMLIKLLSLIRIINETGNEINQGTLLRFLNEMMWFPTAALNDYIKWSPVDSNSAQATMSYKGVTASAIFYFDEQGKITNMIAERCRYVDGEFAFDQWSTPISEYGEFCGIRIPSKGEGVWNLKSGDFSYIRLKITDIRYNNPSLY